MSRDYVFHINWDDGENNHRVGFFAQLNNKFYLVIRNQDDAILAYKKGFNGMSGYDTGRVYMSENEVFDTVQDRVLNKTNPYDELVERGGSFTDSFSFEKASERMTHKYKQIILRIYDLQQREAHLLGEGAKRRRKKVAPTFEYKA